MRYGKRWVEKMANNWTDEQKLVIELHDRNILVSAAAGSGKTAVLVERIIKMITREENPIDIDRLVIVTFTNMAAYEMRMRIMNAIADRLAKEPDNKHLERQLTLVHSAKITTIDSFCLNIVKSYFNEADLDPAFRVADEGELKLLSADVMKSFLEECYREGDEDFYDFVDCFAPQKNDGKIEEYILKLYRFSQSYPWPKKWLEECLKEYECKNADEYMHGKNMNVLMSFIKKVFSSIKDDINNNLKICGQPCGPYMYLSAVESDAKMISALTENDDFDNIRRIINDFSFERLSSKKDENVSPELKELVKETRDSYKKTVEKLKKDYFSVNSAGMYEQSLKCGKSVRTLINLTLGYVDRMEKAKREKKIINFSDMEHIALNILVKEEDGKFIYSPAADELAMRYDEILIDEYQDSNMVQEIILNSISRERYGNNNVFMVGDVKQSIYKFRLARPELFVEKYTTYTTDESLYQKIELFKNFRSRKTVLDSVNAVFSNIMSSNLGGIDYNENAMLNAGASFPKSDECFGNTQICLLEHNNTHEYNNVEAEAVVAAGIITDIVSGKSGKKVYDKELGGYRTPKLRDIVILLRSIKGWADTYVEILNSRGIPAYSESATGYFGTVEIRTLLSFLAVIDNPRQDIHLAAVLKSYFAGLTDDELAGIRALNIKLPLYDAVLESNNPKIENLLGILEKYREYSRYMDISSLIWKLAYDTGYYDYVGTMPAGAERQSNINVLVEKAKQYGNSSYKGLFNFLRYMDKLKTYEVDFAGASQVSDNDNIVRIMSIHKSKGLEFPIVILAGMKKGFNNMDSKDGIIVDPDNGIGIDYVDIERHVKKNTPAKKAVARKMVMDNLAEEQRVLYVAMTRAKEMLYMTGCTADAGKDMDKWNKSAWKGFCTFGDVISHKNYMDMIMPSALGNGSKYFNVQVIGDDIFDRIKQQRLEIEKQEDNDIDEYIYDEFTYPHKVYDIPVKISVSEIKHMAIGEEEEPAERFIKDETEEKTIPKFLSGEKVAKGASRGSAYHAFLERLDYGKCESYDDIKLQLKNMCRDGFISEESAAAINVKDIVKFVNSEVGIAAQKAWECGKLFREKQFMTGISADEIYKDTDAKELIIVQGVIDMYYETNAGIVLVDYKTDRVPKGDSGRNELISRYRGQLEQYKKAIEMILEKPVTGIKIYSFSLAEVINL